MLTTILRLIINILKKLNSLGTSSTLIIVLAIVAVVAALVIIITPIVVVALVNFLISWQLSSAAKMKGHSFIVTFLMCFILGLPGYFYAVALPDVAKQKQLEAIINTLQTATISLPGDIGDAPANA